MLPEPRRTECRDGLRRRIWWAYPREAPYDEAERDRLRACLLAIDGALEVAGGRDAATQDERGWMATNLYSAISRDFAPLAERLRARDRAMFLNLARFVADLPRGSRVVVWCATVHAARSARVTQDWAGGGNLGERVSQAYGRRAFVLGFSAAGGAHYWSRSEPSRAIPSAPPGSAERRALAGAAPDAVYLDRGALRRMGPVSASAFAHTPLTARWDEILDGLVVFAAERPPIRTD